MEAVLIYPCKRARVDMGLWPPLGISYVAAVLEKNGYKTRIIDRGIINVKNNENIAVVNDVTKKILEKENPRIVGISATTALIPDAYETAKLVKRILPNCLVVLGGTHATILPVKTLEECREIDVVVRGEGEFTFLDLVKNKNFDNVKGICYRKNNKIITNPAREPIEALDELPFPARHLLDMKFYTSIHNIVIRGVIAKATHIFTIRGCPYKCSFCAGSAAFGRKLRYHSVDYVIKEIKHLILKYKVKGIYFAEDMFLSNRQRATELCNALIKEGLNKKIVWCAQVRVNSVDEDILRLMKKAGCVQVEYGFESGSQKMLDIMKKHTTADQNYTAARLARKVGLRFLADIIVGIPGEEKEDFIKTTSLIRETKPDVIGFNIFIPLPGSELFDMLQSKGLINPDWGKFNVDNTTGKSHFGEMGNREFLDMYDDFNDCFVRPWTAKSYLKYNLIHHPIGLLRKIFRMTFENPKKAFKVAGRVVG